jgi:hypothetical protein
MVAGQVYGLVDTYRSIERFNRQLRGRLGLPLTLSLDLGGARTPEGVAFGPRLGFTF